jgi:serine/threonine-protein phosphatase 5
VVVVGDTHGQFTDLLTIFRLGGMPSPSNVYLFNGDYVDRGPQDVEVLLTLYSIALAHPGSVYFNRGNHEQRHMNEVRELLATSPFSHVQQSPLT